MEELNGYFAVHSQGLGHASRAIALARGLLERRPELYFLFLAGVPALDLLVANGFDALTAPPAPDWPASNGTLGPVWRWYREYARYLRVAQRFLKKEGDWEYYRFLISESELASVREAVRHHVPTALVVNEFVRDFARDSFSRAWEGVGNFWFSRLARKVDLVLATDQAPDWPNVRRIGPIVRAPSGPREKLREELVFRKKTILVTVGGTAVGEFLIKAAVKAFLELKLDDASMIVVSGPKLKVEPAPGVYTYGFLPNLQDFVFAADLVIATAGKGTLNEALAFGTPVIAIPPKGHSEAERNAAELGYSFGDVHRLRELIPEKLAQGRRPPTPTGNEQAVNLLSEFIEGKAGSPR
jgi:UDP-N-acetylglucosamine--N-acetylmuramyl-(pentapeptide) pyrophosphoryl-undecaprenol N-acetylglucosamine transferase